jgi:hypothetical protein
MKSPKIVNIIEAYIPSGSFISSLIMATVWKRIRATASLTIPSPKITEKSFGYSSYLTIEMAAITSDEQSNEAMTKHSIKLSCKGTHLFQLNVIKSYPGVS